MTGVAIAVLSAWNHHLLKEFFVKTMFLALGVAAILSGTLVASNAAAEHAKNDNRSITDLAYACGMEVGKAIGVLAGTSVQSDAKNLSEDIKNLLAQVQLLEKPLSGSARKQVEQAAQSSLKSIQFSLKSISQVNPRVADVLRETCKIEQ